jgi:hypothetical protein
MLTRLAAVAALSTALLAAARPHAARAEDPKPPPGFTALFNGKDLTGWQGHIDMRERAKLSPEERAKLQAKRNEAIKKQWSVEDGAIRLTPPKDRKGGVSLQTVKDYGNFELMVDWKIEKGGDSGIYLRGQPQVQIWDSDNLAPSLKEDAGTGSGGLWNNQPKGSKGQKPLKKADKPVGEWNTFHIAVVGDEVTIKLNGELIIDKAPLQNYWDRGKPVPNSGPIELQYHGDNLWFKNIYVKELP